MVKAIRFTTTGGPEVLEWHDIELPPPGPGEVRLRHTAVGLNFIDTYHRAGLYPVTLPSGLGMEAAGIVEALGEGVNGLSVGERVAYASSLGAYAEARNIDAASLWPLPEAIDDPTAASIMVKGLTAHYLLRQIHRVKPGDTILVHAAAGGVGQIACQWANHLGATVIGTAGGPEKVAVARANGCHHVIDYNADDFVAGVREITNGGGVCVVYDSVGKDTFFKSIDCLAPLGTMVTYGNASGPAPAIEPLLLAQKGSLTLVRPVLFHYMADPEDARRMVDELFAVITSGTVKITVGQTYALKDAAHAHRDLEARKTIGTTVLLP